MVTAWNRAKGFGLSADSARIDQKKEPDLWSIGHKNGAPGIALGAPLFLFARVAGLH